MVAFNDIVIILLAAAAMAGVFFSYLYRPIKIEIQKRHSDDLKKLVRRWKDEVPLITSANKPIIFHPNPLELPVEKEYLFGDIRKHVPPDLDLFKTWERFKSQYYEYQSALHDFFEDIRQKACDKTGLRFDWKEGGITEHFIAAIYRDAFSVARGERRYRFETIDQLSERRGSDNFQELWSSEGYGLARDKSQTAIEKAKNVYVEMLNELPGAEYENRARKLIGYQKSLEEQREIVLRKLNDFISVPIFPGKCRYIGWSLSGVLGKLKSKFKRSRL